MITPILENMILSGKARYKTFSTGGSGVATIQCPKNSLYIIVVDFIWHPFADLNLETEANWDTLTGKQIHTMRMRNGKNTFIYNFRDSYSTGNRAAATGFVPFFPSAKQYNTYIISKQDIQIDIFKFAQPKLAAWQYDQVPITTNEPDQPHGYARQTAVRKITTGSGAIINTIGNFRDPAVTPDNPANRNEFFDDILTPPAGGDDNKLANPGVIPNVFCFPLVTFGIVEVNETPDSELR